MNESVYDGTFKWEQFENSVIIRLFLKRGGKLRGEISWLKENPTHKYYRVDPEYTTGYWDEDVDVDTAKTRLEDLACEAELKNAQDRGTFRAFESVTTYVMTHHEFSALIRSEYGRFDFKAEEAYSWGAGEEFSTYADVSTLSKYRQQELDRFVAGKEIRPPSTFTFLSDLARKGVILEGEYLITVDW